MHIPDGVLSLEISAILGVISLVIFSISAKESRKGITKEKLPIIIALIAFIAIAQTFNFPILGGTYGHLVAGAMLALLFGFSPAVVMMSFVLVIQAVFFHDGGIFALGANVMMMAIITPLVGAGIRKFLHKNFIAAATLTGAVSAAVAIVL